MREQVWAGKLGTLTLKLLVMSWEVLEEKNLYLDGKKWGMGRWPGTPLNDPTSDHTGYTSPILQ